MFDISDALFMKCPVCRSDFEFNSVKYLRNYTKGEMPSIVIKRSYSTKIDNIVLKCIELISEDPSVNILVLTSVSIAIISY